MSSHTMEEIAASYELWMEYFDRLCIWIGALGGTVEMPSREAFEATPMAERLEMIAACGSAPENCEGCNAPTNNAEGGRCADCSTDE